MRPEAVLNLDERDPPFRRMDDPQLGARALAVEHAHKVDEALGEPDLPRAFGRRLGCVWSRFDVGEQAAIIVVRSAPLKQRAVPDSQMRERCAG